MTNDPWSQPFNEGIKCPADLYWPMVWAMDKEPAFSIFSQDARRGFANIIVEGLVGRVTKSE